MDTKPRKESTNKNNLNYLKQLNKQLINMKRRLMRGSNIKRTKLGIRCIRDPMETLTSDTTNIQEYRILSAENKKLCDEIINIL